MSTFRRFIKFIEITTKLASIIPFFIGLAYTYYLMGYIDAFHTLILLTAVMLFDIPVTMINNYLDKRRSGETPHFSKPVSLAMIIPMVAGSAALGVFLTYRFGAVVLFTGMFCFFIGIFYSASPISISRTPYGEIVSGLVQGFCITFLVVYINSPGDYLVTLELDMNVSRAAVNIPNMIRLGFITAPAILCISNIMLANNTCDVERDTQNRRYTLPYYIGGKTAALLFQLVYAALYAALLISVIIGAAPPVCLLVLLTIPIVKKNAAVFAQNPVKSRTFILSLRNFITILIPYIVTLFAGGVYRWWGYH
ncbi:MAG: UbiA family prenyltransferase [Clostridiales bacterium]|jgi:1,4-dihydroxy-2-naphthoate octaprenyltransferase|nr:UbiA family prenyltransferase [Clostridiales bacterium]